MTILLNIPFKFAVKALLLILVLLIFFHLLIIFKWIPYDIVWGGRLESDDEMLHFELISLALNFVILLSVFFRAGYFYPIMSRSSLLKLFWAFTILFLLNTVANLLSLNAVEIVLFTPLTAILTVLSARVAMNSD